MSADPLANADLNEELVDYEEEEVPEGDAAKGEQVGLLLVSSAPKIKIRSSSTMIVVVLATSTEPYHDSCFTTM